MKKIPKFVWVMVVLAGIFVAAQVAWNAAYPSGTFRYKMTVTVETPEGIKTGSAVREVHAHVEPRLFPEQGGGGYFHVVRGEAIVVDLGARGVLFALMRGGPYGVDYAERILFDAFPFSSPMTKAGVEHYLSLKSGKAILTPEQYPMFVRFRDINNSETVENLLTVAVCKKKTLEGICIEDETGVATIPQMRNNSYIKEDLFAEAFGTDVKLKSVTIEMTDAPVTRGIDKYLPWLGARINNPKEHPGYLGGSGIFGMDPTKTYLTGVEFIKGKK